MCACGLAGQMQGWADAGRAARVEEGQGPKDHRRLQVPREAAARPGHTHCLGHFQDPTAWDPTVHILQRPPPIPPNTPASTRCCRWHPDLGSPAPKPTHPFPQVLLTRELIINRAVGGGIPGVGGAPGRWPTGGGWGRVYGQLPWHRRAGPNTCTHTSTLIRPARPGPRAGGRGTGN